jgi:hypothetical protein
MSDYTNYGATLSAAGAQRLGELVHDLEHVRSQMLKAEAHLQSLKDRETTLKSIAIPREMDSHQVREVRLPDGTAIKVEDNIVCSPKKDDRPRVVEWLKTVGGEPLLTRTIELSFAKKTPQAAIDATRALSKQHPCEVTVDEAIHPSTLRVHVRKLVEEGVPVPDYVGTFCLREAKIARPVFDGEAIE